MAVFLACPLGFDRQLAQTPADMHRAAVAEQPLDLAEDHRHGVGGELQTARAVKAAQRLAQSETSGGVQLLIFHPLARKALAAGVYQPEVLLGEGVFVLSHPRSAFPA